jgi:hypothetical protein
LIVTNLARPAERVVAFYNQRGTAEQCIKEGKAAGAAGAGMTALWGRMAWHGSRWEKCALMKAKEQVPPPQRGRPAVFPGLLCSRFATAVAEKPKGTIMASIFSRIRGMSV